jgi:hypothetical protein
MASTFDVNTLWARIEVDAQSALSALDTVKAIRKHLGRQLALGVFTESGMSHIKPAGELSSAMRDDELIERWRDLSIGAFDAACVEHLLSCLKVSIGPCEVIR